MKKAADAGFRFIGIETGRMQGLREEALHPFIWKVLTMRIRLLTLTKKEHTVQKDG